MSRSSPRVLLISSSVPGAIGVGGVLLEDSRTAYGPDSVFAFVVSSFGEAFKKSKSEGGPSMVITEACSWKISTGRFGRVGKFLSWIVMAFENERVLRRLVKKAELFAKQNDIEKIWAVLEAPITMHLTHRLAHRLGKPCHVVVWDDVEQLMPLFGVNNLSKRSTRRAFAASLQAAHRVAVIGETMKREYARKYWVESTIIRHGIDSDLVIDRQPTRERGEPLRIGFTGSVSAKSAFFAFTAALDEAGWKLNGRDVVLQITGLRFVLECRSPSRIEYLGWRTVDECVELLSRCDINYLPQPFEPELESLSRLSFPTKLTTYLAAKRPIFLHCPSYSSLKIFNDENQIAKWSGTLDADNILKDLGDLVSEDGLRHSTVEAANIVLKEKFSREQFNNAFRQFMGLN